MTTIKTVNTIDNTNAIRAAVSANNMGINLDSLINGKLEVFGREIQPIGKFGQIYCNLAGFATAKEFHSLEDNIEGMVIVDPSRREASYNQKLINVLQLMELWNSTFPHDVWMSINGKDGVVIATEETKYEGVWLYHAYHDLEFMVIKENGVYVSNWFFPNIKTVKDSTAALWQMIKYRKGLAQEQESPIQVNKMGSINSPTSEAFKAFTTSIETGEGIKVATLRADEARSRTNIEDIKLGLPMMAVGDFVDVKDGWGDLCSPNSSDYREYISGSGTRYLVSWQGDVIARIKTSETRSEW